MGKTKFFIDMDITIVDSIKRFCKIYNTLYANHPEFKPADHTKILKYNFSDICPLVTNSLEIFHHELFFKDLEFINHNTYEVLEKLNSKYQLIIASIGTPKNIAMKSTWLEKNLPFIKDYILIVNNGCKMNKSFISMSDSGSIFVDDIPSNLESTNAETKILFGKIYPWNEGWQGEHCSTWSEIEERFLQS